MESTSAALAAHERATTAKRASRIRWCDSRRPTTLWGPTPACVSSCPWPKLSTAAWPRGGDRVPQRWRPEGPITSGRSVRCCATRARRRLSCRRFPTACQWRSARERGWRVRRCRPTGSSEEVKTGCASCAPADGLTQAACEKSRNTIRSQPVCDPRGRPDASVRGGLRRASDMTSSCSNWFHDEVCTRALLGQGPCVSRRISRGSTQHCPIVSNVRFPRRWCCFLWYRATSGAPPRTRMAPSKGAQHCRGATRRPLARRAPA
jgi:hypothetical protein